MTVDEDKRVTDRSRFGGLPMGDLIGGPLVAASEANLRLANATADFIRSIGFGASPGGQAADPGPTGQFHFTGPPGTDPLTFLTGPGIGAHGPGAPVLPFAPAPEEPEE